MKVHLILSVSLLAAWPALAMQANQAVAIVENLNDSIERVAYQTCDPDPDALVPDCRESVKVTDRNGENYTLPIRVQGISRQFHALFADDLRATQHANPNPCKMLKPLHPWRLSVQTAAGMTPILSDDSCALSSQLRPEDAVHYQQASDFRFLLKALVENNQ